MNMRKILLLFCLCFLIGGKAMAQGATDDCFTFSEATLTPNGEYVELTVGLNGSRLYTAYNLDIILPAGVDVALNAKTGTPRVSMIKNADFYPNDYEDDPTYSHSISYTYGVVGSNILRVSCSSTMNESFLKTSGDLFKVYLVASAFAKPGKNTIKVSGCNLTAIEGGEVHKYVPADNQYEVLTIGNSSSLTLSINAANKFSTCILPFDYTPSGFTAYTADAVEDDFITLTEANTMSAYTPYIIYSETGYSGTASGTVDASKYVATATAGILTGAIEPQDITDGYVLQNKDNGNGAMFYKVNGQKFRIPSGKCWIGVSASVKDFLGFNVEEASGIHATSSQVNDQTIYDLSGNQVSTCEAGRIYIINGKKVLKIK